MMQLRLDGWRTRFQESARFMRSGFIDETRSRQANENFGRADLLWSEAKAEAINLGSDEIKKIKVP